MFGRKPFRQNALARRRSLLGRLADGFGVELTSLATFLALPVAVVIGCIAAWMTHVVVCLMAGKWGFLIAGAIMFPIAVVHGVMIWFGFGN